jgi:hypothetical protein
LANSGCLKQVRRAFARTLPLSWLLIFSGCASSTGDPSREAPPPARVEIEDFNLIRVRDPAKVPLSIAAEYLSKAPLTAIGTVTSDFSPWVSGAWRSAETGSTGQFLRTTRTAFIPVRAQCELFESDVRGIHVGLAATLRLNNGSGESFSGHVMEIGPLFGSPVRRAMVKIEARSSQSLSGGTLVIAAFPIYKREVHAAIPAQSILHFRARSWVYLSETENRFRRVNVILGEALPEDMQEILFGVNPADRIVRNPLALQNTWEQ